jgi:hypothetical protein
VLSENLESEMDFEVIENEKVDVRLVNKTILAVNRGNVPYNDTLVVKIGNESVDFMVSLEVGEEQKYALSAPKGNYSVEVFNEGKSVIREQVALTGNVVSVKESRETIFSLINYPLIWIFVVLTGGFIAFMVFKGSGKRSFIGYICSRKDKPKQASKEEKAKVKESLLENVPSADLSLSIQGDKQRSSVVCLNVHNFDEVKQNKDKVKETLEKLSGLVHKSKAAIYQNQDNIFFIFSPLKTRTFKNEKAAVELAQSIKQILLEHNKLFKQKIDFGIAVNSGEVIAKAEKGILKFMSLGGFITGAKKVSSLAKEDVYLTKEAKEKLEYDSKTEKHSEGDVEFFTIKEMRDREQSRKFIGEFMKRLKDEKK